MSKKTVSSLNRAAMVVLGLLVILFASLFLALYFHRHRQELAQLPVTTTPGAEISRLELVSGQQMSSDNYNFSTNVSGPAALQLPLRTQADFPASASATIAHIQTSKGPLTVTLYPELAPTTVANFVSLGQSGFYDDLRFHRVEPGFVVQIGDPGSRGVDDPQTLAGLGTGYPGYRIIDEFGAGLSHDGPGVLSMANINLDGSYPDSGGSQFFITLAPATYLDGRHAIFGRVTAGQEVLEKLEVADAIETITFE